jgi:hypothetical protein
VNTPPLLVEVAAGVVRVALAFVFAAACLHKLRAPRRFEGALRAYRVLPDSIIRWVAPGLMAAEATIAIGVCLPAISAKALCGAGLLLVSYSAGIALNLARGRSQLDCGCGFGAQPISPMLIARNLLLTFASFSLWLMPTQAWPDLSTSRGFVEALLILSAAGGLLLCHRAFETLQSNRPALERLEVAGR